MSDLISRQAAIDAVKSRKTAEQSSAGIMRNAVVDFCVDIIKKLPSAQPQPVVRCKDCRFQDKGSNESESWNLCGYRPWLHVPTKDEHYCGYAERRTNE